jgi:uncharacterized protein (UPF0276 family)
VDTHDRKIIDEVWQLYVYAIITKGQKTTLVEWDEDIPPLEVLMAEIEKAKIYQAPISIKGAA